MQNSSNNNEQGWKQKLDAFEDASGNNFDKEAAWNKLQQRKPAAQQTRKAWYWLAAACLAGLGILIVTRSNFHFTNFTPPDVVQTNRLVLPAETAKVIIQNEPAVILYSKDEHVPIKHRSLALKIVKEKKNMVEEQLLVDKQSQSYQTVTTVTDSIAAPVIPVIAAAKKLKVVHINELNASENNINIAQQESRPYFPINAKSKQVYTNNSGNSKSGKDNLIKIRLN